MAIAAKTLIPVRKRMFINPFIKTICNKGATSQNPTPKWGGQPLRLWSRLVYNEESIACEPCRVGLRPAVLLFQHPVRKDQSVGLLVSLLPVRYQFEPIREQDL
jgi:hypothetical protein